MGCHFRRDSSGGWWQRKRFRYSPGKERFLQKLVLEAAGSISEKILGWKCSVEGQRVYTHESDGQKTNSGLVAGSTTQTRTSSRPSCLHASNLRWPERRVPSGAMVMGLSRP